MAPLHKIPDRFNEWKEIASYLGVSISTAKRLHSDGGMPVHKRGFSAKARVYAIKSELDEWKVMGKSQSAVDVDGSMDVEPASITPLSFVPEFAPAVELNHTHTNKWSPSPWLWLVLIVPLAAAVAAWTARPVANTPPQLELHSITTEPGLEEYPSLSPDATHIVFSRSGYGLFIKPVDGGGSERKLTDSPDYSGGWSPDGRWIAFVRKVKPDCFNVMVIPPQGGEPRTLAQVAGIGLAWSSDSRMLAVADRIRDGPFAINLIALATGERQRLTDPPAGSWGDTDFRFSPDGKSIAFVRYSTKGVGDLFLSTATGGEARKLTNAGTWFNGIAWTPDSREIVFSTCMKACGLFRLEVAATKSATIRIPAGVLAEMPVIGMLPNGKERLVYDFTSNRPNLHQVRRDRPEEKESPLAPSTLGEEACAFSPDGKSLAFISHRSRRTDLWVANKDGSGARQLTFEMGGTVHQPPDWSADGSRLAFVSNIGGWPSIYTISKDGGPPSRLTSEAFEEGFPSWSNDGKVIYFRSKRSGSPSIWKIASDGSGEITRVVEGVALRAMESLDGKTLYFTRGYDASPLWKVPAKGGKEQELAGSPKVKVSDWTVVSEGIIYLDSQDNSKPGELPVRLYRPTDGKAETIRWISRDGKVGNMTSARDGGVLVWTRWYKESDIMRIDGFR